MLTNLKLSFALCVVVTTGAVAVSAQAFNTGSHGERAVSGAGSVTGFAVTDMKFTYISAGATISDLTFHLDRPAVSARIAFGGAVWNGCTVATTADVNGKYAASCPGLSVPRASAHDLAVVAQAA